MSCSRCDERNSESDDDWSLGCENCSCGCHGCDCCDICAGGPLEGDEAYSCCGSYPEYNCPGECRHRGEPGHYSLKPAGDPHPTMSWPERFCMKPCCRPAARAAENA